MADLDGASGSTKFEASDRSRLRRVAKRASYDKATVYSIIDAAPICHVGFVEAGQPFVIPSLHARQGDELLLHGARASRLINHIGEGHEICVTITLLDGIVLARSIYHHSMNYRSVVLFGRGRALTDEDEKLAALEALSEQLLPGRWGDARQPNPQELAATSVVAIAIQEASAKIRSGPPTDEPEDHSLRVWAGELPLEQRVLDPVPDPKLPAEIAVPGYLRSYRLA